jgi:trk system potassium uptake protein TrkA
LARNTDPVVIIGLGRFGRALADELVRLGTEVLAIDPNPDLVQQMAGRLERVVNADPTNPAVLEELGVDEFRNAVVAIGGEETPSILATSLLADMGIENIWAKAMSPLHASVLSRVGAHHVVFPEKEMGVRVAHLISGRMLDYVEIDRQWVLAKTRPPASIVGTPLGETGLRARRGVTVVSVRKEGTDQFTHAEASTVLAYGDEIMLVGKPADVERFVESA